ncbi:MAG TPA: inactive transglutaminase family protein [Gammaproteobacteria bacterium]
MSSRRTPFYLLVILLVAAGSLLTWYRHAVFDVPWLPGEKRQIWSVEAKVDFFATGEPVKVSLAIPATQPGFEQIGEHTASPGYGLAFVENGNGRRAEWSIRSATGNQTLYYQTEMLVDPETLDDKVAVPPALRQIVLVGPQATAARRVLQRATERSADPWTLARELIGEFNSGSESAQLLTQTKSRGAWLVDLLHMAGVPAREVQALNLEDGRRRQDAVNLLQVFDGESYALFDVRTGVQGQQPWQLLWEYSSSPLLDIVGGDNSRISFSMIAQDVPVSRMLQAGTLSLSQKVLDFSIHSLPLSEQALFKGILLIPVGVLIVSLFRILVGVRTSGTFMPVLIAIAFIQTSLVTGLVGFLLIVGVGLLIRSYLSRLNLLLVARISAVIISVIIIIAAFAVLSFQLGLAEGLKITIFPMVILAWTIERMSILWEEEGPKEVLVQGSGSLLVALLAWLMMSNDIVRHLTFNFLGLQFIFMALVLLLGNYTGYRLMEFRRFRPLLKAQG